MYTYFMPILFLEFEIEVKYFTRNYYLYNFFTIHMMTKKTFIFWKFIQLFSTFTGWAHAATSALSDRIKIMRNASWPDFNISPQVLISCGPDDGCHGGDSGNANAFMATGDGITDETCSIYR